MEATVDNLKPLITATDENSVALLVTFTCPSTGTEVRSEGRWPEEGLVGSQVKYAKRTLFSTIRNQIATSVRQTAGSSMLGNAGGQAVANIVSLAGNDVGGTTVKHNQKAKDHALLQAFDAVQQQFAWDGKRWVHAGSAAVETSPFEDHLAQHPLREDYDRELLPRLLAALVAADGKVDKDERASFAALAPGADLDALVKRRAPSPVDFEETAKGQTRETILLLGWAVALSDEELASEEEALLELAAKGLGIDEPRAAELKGFAQRHIVASAIGVLASQGTAKDSIRAQAEDLGERIGLGADEAARVYVRWSKRS